MPAIAPTNKAKSKKANNLVTMSPDVSRSVEGKDRKKKQVKSTFEAKKMSKKRKTVDEQEEESSDTTSDSAKLALLNQKAWVNGSVPKKPRIAEESNDEDDDDEGELTGSGEEDAGHEDPNALSNFRISKVLMEKLKSRGIKALFPIQAMTFNIIFEGSDLVGRARTGQGKTLAFVLPILESLTNGQHKVSKKTGYGRTPSVLVLLPTRELANQVHTDFEIYGGSLGLSSCCLYGGAPYRPQESALKRGVDIVIGTPGRIKDHIERGTLNLMSLKFRVLDEADEMLNMGFVDDVELILGKVGDVSKVQTLLFSATLPDWVKKIATRFQKPTKKTVDLVGNEKLKASASVQHVVIPCSSEARPRIIPDLISCYSRGGRSIIFTETRESASKLSGSLPGSRALHGDIVQAQREVIISGFRSGKFLVLVATNVAARGLDINDVQLIIQCEPPRDVEAYIHRSGRTGRAGNTGVAILLYDPRYSHYVSKIEKQSGVKFEHMSAPQTSDIAKTAGSDAADAIMKVSDSVITIFRSQAEELQKKSGLSPADLLAKALAKASGCSEIKKRSILTSLDDYVTLHLDAGKQLFSPTFVFSLLKRFMSEEKIGGIKHLSITADSMGAVFDVPADYVSSFIEGQKNANMVNIKVLQKVPPLQERESNASFGGGGRRFGGGGGRFGGRGRGSGGFGGKSSGFSGRGRANSGSRNRFNRN